MVEIYEDNGGGIHAVVIEHKHHKDGTETYDLVNVISGIEYCAVTGDKFIREAINDFPYADRYKGDDIFDAAVVLAEYAEPIAFFDDGKYELFPDKMGVAGKKLFEIKE